MNSNVSGVGAIGAVAVAAAIAGAAMLINRDRGPDATITIATGKPDSDYHRLALDYQAHLLPYGVNLKFDEKQEGFAALQALVDDKSGVQAAFVKGGLIGSLQGRLARGKGKDWREAELDNLRSVGRLFYEPIWVYTRGDLPIESLRDLEKRKILVGTRESGSRRIASQLLRANGIETRQNPLIINEDLEADARQLFNGTADAAIVIAAADSPKAQALLRVPNIRLMNFAPEADAYTERFPAYSRVVLRRGSVEFQPVIPSADITLLSTSAALVIRKDLHPALISLLTHAVYSKPRSGFDRAGDPVLFYRAGQFPSASDPEFTVAEDARQVYKTGELPLMLRVLAPLNERFGIPFAVAAFANTYGAQTLLLLIPALTILIPMFRLVPMLYNWSVRRRLLYWYRQLKALEAKLDGGWSNSDAPALASEIDRIDAAVRRIKIPLNFSDQFYDLRGHIDLVRQRINVRPVAFRMAAE